MSIFVGVDPSPQHSRRRDARRCLGRNRFQRAQHPDLVADATASGVSADRDLGFVRNGSARQLACRQEPLGGRDRCSTSPTVLHRGHPRHRGSAAGENCVLVLCSSDDSVGEEESNYLGVLEEQRVRGVLITPATRDVRGSNGCNASAPPSSCSTGPARRRTCAQWPSTDVLGGELAGATPARSRARRIGFINGPRTIRNQCADRRRGLRKAVRAAGLDPTPSSARSRADAQGEGGETGLYALLTRAASHPARVLRQRVTRSARCAH